MKTRVYRLMILTGLMAISVVIPLSSAASGTAPGLSAPEKQAVEKAFPPKRPYSPYAGRNFPPRPLFGDTHLHTSFSMDAGAHRQ